MICFTEEKAGRGVSSCRIVVIPRCVQFASSRNVPPGHDGVGWPDFVGNAQQKLHYAAIAGIVTQ